MPMGHLKKDAFRVAPIIVINRNNPLPVSCSNSVVPHCRSVQAFRHPYLCQVAALGPHTLGIHRLVRQHIHGRTVDYYKLVRRVILTDEVINCLPDQIEPNFIGKGQNRRHKGRLGGHKSDPSLILEFSSVQTVVTQTGDSVNTKKGPSLP
jgi:hypothetical protein